MAAGAAAARAAAGKLAKSGQGGNRKRNDGGGGGSSFAVLGLLGLVGFVLMIFVLFAPLFLIAGIAGGEEEKSTTFTSNLACGGKGCGFLRVPEGAKPYVEIYLDAARVYRVNPFLLMAVHEDESDYGRGPGIGIRSGTNFAACCAGPMQFSIAGGATREIGGTGATWAGFADAYEKATLKREIATYPDPTKTHPNVYDAYDSIYAAAKYFHFLHAGPQLDQATYDALRSYKGNPPASDPFAQHDYDRAKELEQASGAIPPPSVFAMYAKVEEIEAMNLPYVYGGGHGGTPFEPPYDCSSFVSTVLHEGGLIGYITNTVGLMSWGDPKEGRWLTVWTRGAGTEGHTFLEFHVGGEVRFAETNGAAGSHAGWRSFIDSTGYTARHWPGT